MAKRQIAPEKKLNNQSGFTLIEVMIAISIFAVFATVFVTGFGYNLLDSGKIKEDILLKDYCENKLNDIISNPPTLSDSLTLTKDTKDVENDSNYQTIVEFKKFTVPDVTKIMGNPGAEEGGQSEEQSQQAQMQKRIFTVYKENMEKMIWQVEVTVRSKLTSETFRLSSWIYNQQADVKIGTF
ncbi:MAG: prepilin-type N-terminal cleavage/methylation domain-containing protein [Bacteriovorax sp.]|nr:prepilin-type N-terminal cleavage/methylation domain-containing protein [Bacteriovorax sp.]